MNDFVLWQFAMFLLSRNAWKRIAKRIWYPWRKWGVWEIAADPVWGDCKTNSEYFSRIEIPGDSNTLPTYYGLERLMSCFLWTQIYIVRFNGSRIMAAGFCDDAGQVRWRLLFPDKKGRVAFLRGHEGCTLYFFTFGSTQQAVEESVTGDISLLHASHKNVPLY